MVRLCIAGQVWGKDKMIQAKLIVIDTEKLAAWRSGHQRYKYAWL